MEKTQEMVSNEFITNLHTRFEDATNGLTKEQKKKIDMLIFGTLCDIDGEGMHAAFILAPMPHKDDKAYLESQGKDWFPENVDNNVKCDISGDLHERWAKLTNYLEK